MSQIPLFSVASDNVNVVLHIFEGILNRNYSIPSFLLDHCMFTSCPFYGSCSVGKQGSTTCSCPGAYSCPRETVCASDGLNYGDECKMKIQACKKRKQLTVVHKVACSECTIVVMYGLVDNGG